jgi:site-specific DNA-methyltransferase (adenine-specific)
MTEHKDGLQIDIRHGDCLELMKGIPDKSIDMILCDLPYQRTQNQWDIMIPISELWDQYNRIIKDSGCIALFADGMFMAELMLSNKKMWKYNLVWDKVLPTGFLNANRMPLRSHEEICIFYKRQPTYNPQKVKGKPSHSRGKPKEYENNNYGDFEFVDNSKELGDMKHPVSIVRFPKPHPSVSVHPTQKSVEVCEWLIKSYTNEGEWVLDNCMGSGSTGVACKNTGRHFIGIELDKNYFNIAKERIGE